MGASTVILIDSGDDESGDEVIITGSSCIPGDVEEVAPPASRPCRGSTMSSLTGSLSSSVQPGDVAR